MKKTLLLISIFILLGLLVCCSSYEIIYNLDGGTNANNPSSYEGLELPYDLSDPVKDGYIFDGWYTDPLFTIDSKVTCISRNAHGTVQLYCKWLEITDTVYYDYGDYVFYSKDSLAESFYTAFYEFIKTKEDGVLKLSECEIENATDFINFAYLWDWVNPEGVTRSNLYGFGDSFSIFFLTQEENGLLENQSSDTFIGYCYEKEMFIELIEHLITFFAYWRTDEGYTGSADDPGNHGNDFFFSPWASLVDTAKFFYFTSETLNDKYAWFNSKRVKDALDNIPCVISDGIEYSIIGDELILPIPVRMGYTFLGWYDNKEFENGKITKLQSPATIKILYAKWNKE